MVNPERDEAKGGGCQSHYAAEQPVAAEATKRSSYGFFQRRSWPR